MLPQCAKTELLLVVKHAKQEANLLEPQQAHDETVKGQMEVERRFSMLKSSSSSTEKHDNKHLQPRIPNRKRHE